MTCDTCHNDRGADEFRPYPKSKSGFHSTCNRCHQRQMRKARGGIHTLRADVPEELRPMVDRYLDSADETPQEWVIRLVRESLARQP